MNAYIDEFGSINLNNHKNFIIAIVMPTDKEKLKRVYKRFVSKNLVRLKILDKDNKMFRKDGTFLELKGSCFDRKMKLDFLDYFCRNDLFKVRYIVLNNDKLESRFIKNKARTFNYLMKIFLINTIHRKIIVDRELYLHIDERNVKTDSKFSLEDYLNQELLLEANIIKDVIVKYYDSSQSQLIQIADVFANIKYSDYITNNVYKDVLERLEKEGYILEDFKFPQNKKTIYEIFSKN